MYRFREGKESTVMKGSFSPYDKLLKEITFECVSQDSLMQWYRNTNDLYKRCGRKKNFTTKHFEKEDGSFDKPDYSIFLLRDGTTSHREDPRIAKREEHL